MKTIWFTEEDDMIYKEYDMIHCFKKNESYEKGKELLEDLCVIFSKPEQKLFK